MAADRRIESAHPGLYYFVQKRGSFFVIFHADSGQRIASIYEAVRPVRDFVPWADEALAGVDWTRSPSALASDPDVERAARRFRSGLAWVGPEYHRQVVVDREMAFPDAGEPYGHGHPLVGRRMARR
jgi:hypothetical protein